MPSRYLTMAMFLPMLGVSRRLHAVAYRRADDCAFLSSHERARNRADHRAFRATVWLAPVVSECAAGWQEQCTAEHDSLKFSRNHASTSCTSKCERDACCK